MYTERPSNRILLHSAEPIPMPRMWSFLNVIGSSRSRSSGTAGQGKWCILLAAMQVNYVLTSALEQSFPVFFSFFFGCLWVRFDLLLLGHTYIHVIASTVDRKVSDTRVIMYFISLQGPCIFRYKYTSHFLVTV